MNRYLSKSINDQFGHANTVWQVNPSIYYDANKGTVTLTFDGYADVAALKAKRPSSGQIRITLTPDSSLYSTVFADALTAVTGTGKPLSGATLQDADAV